MSQATPSTPPPAEIVVSGEAAATEKDKKPEEWKPRISVFNLPPGVTSKDDLRELCKPFGSITEVEFVPAKGNRLAFGFVTFKTEGDGSYAIYRLNDGNFGGKVPVKAKWPPEKETKPKDESGEGGKPKKNKKPPMTSLSLLTPKNVASNAQHQNVAQLNKKGWDIPAQGQNPQQGGQKKQYPQNPQGGNQQQGGNPRGKKRGNPQGQHPNQGQGQQQNHQQHPQNTHPAANHQQKPQQKPVHQHNQQNHQQNNANQGHVQHPNQGQGQHPNKGQQKKVQNVQQQHVQQNEQQNVQNTQAPVQNQNPGRKQNQKGQQQQQNVVHQQHEAVHPQQTQNVSHPPQNNTQHNNQQQVQQPRPPRKNNKKKAFVVTVADGKTGLTLHIVHLSKPQFDQYIGPLVVKPAQQ